MSSCDVSQQSMVSFMTGHMSITSSFLSQLSCVNLSKKQAQPQVHVHMYVHLPFCSHCQTHIYHCHTHIY